MRTCGQGLMSPLLYHEGSYFAGATVRPACSSGFRAGIVALSSREHRPRAPTGIFQSIPRGNGACDSCRGASGGIRIRTSRSSQPCEDCVSTNFTTASSVSEAACEPAPGAYESPAGSYEPTALTVESWLTRGPDLWACAGRVCGCSLYVGFQGPIRLRCPPGYETKRQSRRKFVQQCCNGEPIFRTPAPMVV